jgi:hypothetical protein
MENDHSALDRIKCPNCGELFPVSEAIYHQIAEKTREELKAESIRQQKAFAAREKELKDKEESFETIVSERLKSATKAIEIEAENRARDALSLEIADLKRQASEKDVRLNALQKTELEVLARKRELDEKEKSLDLELQRKIGAETERIKAEASKEARDAISIEITDLKAQAAEKDRKLAEAGVAELELRKQKRELEERSKTLELEVARKIDAERATIQEETAKLLQEEYRLKDAEKDKKLQDAMRMNEDLRRKLQQGSQQTQGEVLELELEELIAKSFPTDLVEPVPKGINGADIIQKVMSKSGQISGAIVWETKRTKAWSDGWVQKLKDDQRAVKADIAVLVSEVLPKDCKNFANYEGVWISTPQFAISLAVALRAQLIEVAMVKLAAVGKNEKMEILYQYISGLEFRQRVEAIVEAFVAMQEDVQEERRTAERRWARREKLIQKVISNTSGMYGDFQGLIGSSLQSIRSLTPKTLNSPEDGRLTPPTVLPPQDEQGSDADEIPF